MTEGAQDETNTPIEVMDSHADRNALRNEALEAANDLTKLPSMLGV